MKVVALDLDDTLILSGMKPIPSVHLLLNYLKSKYTLCIASYNRFAEYILKQTNLFQYFSFIQGYEDNNKVKHLESILERFKVEPSQVYFFDDLEENIWTARLMAINAFKVNPRTGITFADLHKAGL